MKRYLLPLTFVVVPFLAMGQLNLSGSVTDSQGASLPGAVVQIQNTYLATSCNEVGFYQFKNLKKGTYTLAVTHLGYKPVITEVQLVTDLSMNFKMEASPVMQDEVVITATRAGEQSPTTYTNIGKAEIIKTNMGQDLPYVLDATPSTVVTSDAGAGVGYTGIRIRGTDITRINVTMNGIPVNDPESQGVFWVNMPDFSSSVDNIQVQRGVGTSTNGAAAFGASINIQTLKLIPESYSEINNSYGSFNTLKNNILLGTGLIDGHWAFDGRISRIASDGYIDRASSNLTSLYLSGGYYGEKQFFKLIVMMGKEKTYQAWNGVPKDSLETNRTYNPFTYENQTDNYRQDHYQFFYSRNLNRKWDLNLALHYTRGKGYYEEFQDINDPWAHTAYADYGLDNLIIGSDTITNTSLVRQKWLNNHFFGMTFSTLYTARRVKLTIGGAANQYPGHHYGKITWAAVWGDHPMNYGWYSSDGTKTDANVFAKFEYLLQHKVNLFADVQYRFVSYEILGEDGNLRRLDVNRLFHFINPKAGVFYKINERHQTYASFAMTGREPNRNNFADADSAHMPVPEHLYDVEAGYYFVHPAIKLNANLFYMHYKNQLVLTGEINDVGYSIMTNVPVSYRTGIEIAVGFVPKKWFSWDLDVAYSINKIKNFTQHIDAYDASWIFYQEAQDLGNTDIAFSPALVGGSRMSFNVCKGLELSLINKYVGKQYIDNTSSSERMLDPFVIHNFMATYAIHTKIIKTIELKFALNNFMNHQYESNAWVYRWIENGTEYTADGYFPQAGINWMGAINFKF
jgi:iron complex outermembrane receptor protein